MFKLKRETEQPVSSLAFSPVVGRMTCRQLKTNTACFPNGQSCFLGALSLPCAFLCSQQGHACPRGQASSGLRYQLLVRGPARSQGTRAAWTGFSPRRPSESSWLPGQGGLGSLCMATQMCREPGQVALGPNWLGDRKVKMSQPKRQLAVA